MRIFWIALICLTVALIAAFVSGRFMMAARETVERAEAPLGPDARFVETRSGRIHMLDRGSGPVVLLIHGTGRSIADWQEGLVDLLAETHRVIAMDYYGHGLSDRNHGLSYGHVLWTRQVVDLLDALEIDRVIIVGHSVGGVIVSRVAADYPERVSHVVTIGTGMAMDPVQIVPMIPGAGEIVLGRTEIFGDTFSDAHRQRLAAAYAIKGTRAALLTYIRRQYTIDGVRLLYGVYEEIQAPVLHVSGSEDASIPNEAARRLSERTGGKFVTVEGIGHDVHIEAPEKLAGEIRQFVQENPS
ncbi:Hydrolase, alpha/beta fold family [Candidatus Phaeomarinobacter ectocarpi]|uniref:Hydrolase, alpha/beta fold family n=2 Tax=Candidatus Phaeomarinibacter ectocarpi TaxID=1458461 RepID=X5MMA6_9HYPH|nr:Hydrolase, alpha/beta fold family [Candidatus Phaeomarinobacter ectocarpi]